MPLTSLDSKLVIMDASVDTYAADPTEQNKIDAQTDIDLYAKEASLAKKNNPLLEDDDFFSDPLVLTEAKRKIVLDYFKPKGILYPSEAYTAAIGSTFMLKGKEYLVVDRALMNTAVKSADNTDMMIAYGGKDYTFGHSPQCIFTGQMTSLSLLFKNNATFNADIGYWDVSNVSTLYGLFVNATAFNQDISSWDVSSVTDMNGVFQNATSFNQPLNDWDVGNVEDMRNLFSEDVAFNQPLDQWDTSSVTNMSYMFTGASSFNQPLNSWKVDNVTDMTYMFYNTQAFNQPLNDWDVGSVTNMYRMFYIATSFNQPLDEWDTSNVESMRNMFYGASTFNQDISGWNTSRVTDSTYFRTSSALTAANSPF